MRKSNRLFLHGECVIVGLCTNIMKSFWEGFFQAKSINLNVRGESIDLHMYDTVSPRFTCYLSLERTTIWIGSTFSFNDSILFQLTVLMTLYYFNLQQCVNINPVYMVESICIRLACS